MWTYVSADLAVSVLESLRERASGRHTNARFEATPLSFGRVCGPQERVAPHLGRVAAAYEPLLSLRCHRLQLRRTHPRRSSLVKAARCLRATVRGTLPQEQRADDRDERQRRHGALLCPRRFQQDGVRALRRSPERHGRGRAGASAAHVQRQLHRRQRFERQRASSLHIRAATSLTTGGACSRTTS
jgi:hypothetical protein